MYDIPCNHLNRLLALQTCEPNLKLYVTKSSSTRYLLIREIFVFINFRELQNLCFSQTVIFSNQTKRFISCTSVFANSVTIFIWLANRIVKMAKTRETCNDLCDMERHPAVIGICQHISTYVNICRLVPSN